MVTKKDGFRRPFLPPTVSHSLFLQHRHDPFKVGIAIKAEDELALLVTAFNGMSARLEENSAELGERRKYIETVLQSLSTGVMPSCTAR